MSAADGFLTPVAARAELEQRYRRLLRLYPREFRARRQDELLGVLMASAGEGQDKPARGDVSDIVRSSLVMRLRGPRGGWRFALSAFALVAPLFLVLTDILQVAFPYSESQAAVQSRISRYEAHGVPAADVPQSMHVPQHDGGLQLLGQPAVLILVAGHLIVAVAVLAGLRRTALAALVVAAAADATQLRSFNIWHQSMGTVAVLTIGVFMLEAIVLAAADPRVARRREVWHLAFPALALAVAAQLWALAFDAARVPMNRGYLQAPIGGATMVTGLVLIALAVLLTLPLGLGWRTSLLLVAACYPLVILAVTLFGLFSRPIGIGRLGQTIGTVSSPVAHTEILTILFLPPLLVLCWAVAQTIRTRRPRNGDLAA
ncbi:MAG: hypothetical protein ACRDP7_34130 [Trebonia sp.]